MSDSQLGIDLRLDERSERYKSAAAELIESVYSRNGAGCCMHIATDDGNIKDCDLLHCLSFAMRRECYECVALAGMLLTIPERLRDSTMGMEQCQNAGQSSI